MGTLLAISLTINFVFVGVLYIVGRILRKQKKELEQLPRRNQKGVYEKREEHH